MAGGMSTRAVLLEAMAAALAATFDESWTVWPTPPDASSVPAVWPEYDSAQATGNITGTINVKVVVVVAPQVSPAMNDRLADAADLLDTIGGDKLGAGISFRTDFLTTVVLGGVDHTALNYTFTLTRTLPC
jgi:hypothetical protein